jgi:hypothetical protein
MLLAEQPEFHVKQRLTTMRLPVWKYRTLLSLVGSDDDVGDLIASWGFDRPPVATVRGWRTRNSIPGNYLPILIDHAMKSGALTSMSNLLAGKQTRSRVSDARDKPSAVEAKRVAARNALANAEARRVFGSAPAPSYPSIASAWRDELRRIVRNHSAWQYNRNYFERLHQCKSRSFNLAQWRDIASAFNIDHVALEATFMAKHRPILALVS